MIAVSDTSPINYLVLIDCIQVLPALFDRIIIPRAVFEELASPSAPEMIQTWLANPPGWFGVQTFHGTDPALKYLDPGERDAILLAGVLNADLLLLDENLERQAARQRKLKVTGTLGLLDRAASRGLIDLSVAMDRLTQTNFRISPKLLQQFRS